MPKTPDRAMLSRLVDAYDRVEEESLGMGDPEFHEIEDQLYEAIVESPYRAVIKNGNIYIPDFNGSPGEVIVVDPAEHGGSGRSHGPQPRRRLKLADRLTWHVGRGLVNLSVWFKDRECAHTGGKEPCPRRGFHETPPVHAGAGRSTRIAAMGRDSIGSRMRMERLASPFP